jgi:hypothetical protein
VQGGRCWGQASDGEDGAGSGGVGTGPTTGTTAVGQRGAGPAMGMMAGDGDDGGGRAWRDMRSRVRWHAARGKK